MKKIFIFLIFGILIGTFVQGQTYGRKVIADSTDGGWAIGDDDLSTTKAVTINAPLHNPVANLLIISGQSNANGAVNISQLPSYLEGDQPGYIFQEGGFQILDATIDSNNKFPSGKGSFGAEMELAYRYNKASGDTLYILKYAISGTSLAQHGSLMDWNVSSTDELYDSLKLWIDSAIYYIENVEKKTINHLGFFWYQGENDALNETYANAYGVNLYNFFDGVRNYIGEPRLPIFEVRIDPANDPYLPAVKEAIDSVYSVLPYIYIIDADTAFYSYQDVYHLKNSGQIKMGNTLARMLNKNENIFSLEDNRLVTQNINGMKISSNVGDTSLKFGNSGNSFLRDGASSWISPYPGEHFLFERFYITNSSAIGIKSQTSNAFVISDDGYNEGVIFKRGSTTVGRFCHIGGPPYTDIGLVVNNSINPLYNLDVYGTGRFTDSCTFDSTAVFNDQIVYADTYYKDIFVGLSGARVPASNAPTWTAYSTNLNSYTFDINDYLDCTSSEINHDYKPGGDIELHLHIIQNGTDVDNRTVKFTIYYSIGNMGSVMSAESSFTGEITILSTDADRTHHYVNIGDLTTTGIIEGATIKMRVKRVASTGTEPSADPFVEMIGIHYEINKPGTDNESP